MSGMDGVCGACFEMDDGYDVMGDVGRNEKNLLS